MKYRTYSCVNRPLNLRMQILQKSKNSSVTLPLTFYFYFSQNEIKDFHCECKKVLSKQTKKLLKK